MTISPVTLTGSRVRLEPLRREHAHGLCLAADEDTFAYLPTRPEHTDLGGFMLYAEMLMESPDIVPFAVIDLTNDRIAGVTSYLDLREPHRGVEIGMTWVGPEFRGGRLNPEMKLLMMTRAFETRFYPKEGSCIRVMFKTDSRNERSQRAMTSLGFVREGVLRKHMILAGGHQRDSVVFSVTDDEWPAIKATLEERLASPA